MAPRRQQRERRRSRRRRRAMAMAARAPRQDGSRTHAELRQSCRRAPHSWRQDANSHCRNVAEMSRDHRRSSISDYLVRTQSRPLFHLSSRRLPRVRLLLQKGIKRIRKIACIHMRLPLSSEVLLAPFKRFASLGDSRPSWWDGDRTSWSPIEAAANRRASDAQRLWAKALGQA